MYDVFKFLDFVSDAVYVYLKYDICFCSLVDCCL